MNSVFIEENNFEKARKKIRESKGKEIIFSSEDDELMRKVMEKEDVNVVLIKESGRKDYSKQRNSGLDSVMSRIAKNKGIKIGILLDEIINSEKKEKSVILGRIRQNIMLCSKNKVKMKFIAKSPENKRNIYDLKSLGLVLGMPTNMVKNLSADAG